MRNRLISLSLVLSLLVGCSPVIFNGNLTFEAYDAPPYYEASLSSLVDEVVLDYESYNIEGTDALYFLPYHGNSPAEVHDVKVYDYNSDGNFVYAYVANYYGDAAELMGVDEDGTGLTASQSGTAPLAEGKSLEMRAVTISQNIVADYRTSSDGSTTDIVICIMSYNPTTRAYNVFHSELHDLDTIQSAVNAEESGLEDTITVTTVDTSISGHKLMDKEEYFICIGNTGYHFSKEGTILAYTNYLSTGKSALAAENISFDGKEIEIMDVVMDGSGFAYVAMTISEDIQIDEDEEVDTTLTEDDNYDDDDEDYEEEPEVGEYLLGQYFLPIESEVTYSSPYERDNNVAFRSSNAAVAAQEEAWLSINETVYQSKSAMETAQSNYSAANIMSGNANPGIADTWSVFNFGNLAMGYLELDGSEIAVLLAKKQTSPLNTLQTETFVSDWYTKGWPGLFAKSSFFEYLIWFYQGRDTENVKEYDSLVEYYIGESLHTLAVPSDFTATHEIGSKIDGLVYFVQTGNEETGEARLYPIKIDYSNVAQSNWNHNAVLATVLAGYDSDSLGNHITMVPTAYSSNLTRTLYYTETTYTSQTTTTTNEEGIETTTTVQVPQETTHSVVEVFPERPTEYSLQFGVDGAYFEYSYSVSWMDLRATADYALPSRELGAYYYSTHTEADVFAGTQAMSGISYNDGTETRLDDQTIVGTAIEAQLYYSDTYEILAVLTDVGVQYYGRAIGGVYTYNYTKGSFLSLDAYSPNASDFLVAETEQNQDLLDAQKDGLDYSGESSAIRSLNQLSMLNNSEMLVTSQTNGLILHNLSSSIFFELEQGCYFHSFPIQSQSGKFMVLGFDTTDYSYTDADLAWAKCYVKDIDASSTSAREGMVISYISSIANLYWQYTHNFGRDENYNLTVLSTTDAQKAVITRAENLFFKGESELTAELLAVLAECGQTTATESIKEQVVELRTEMTARTDAIRTLFDLMGIVRTPLDTSNPALLKLEYEMLYSSYSYQLESILVELYLRQLLGLSQDYDGLGADLDNAFENSTAIPREAWALLEDIEAEIAQNENTSLDYEMADYIAGATTFGDYEGDSLKYLYLLMSLSSIHAATDDWTTSWSGTVTEEQALQATISASQSDGYTDILSLLKARVDGDWDTYISEALQAVNPYNALADAMIAVEKFCSLVGITSTLESEVLKEMTTIYDLIDLERLIVEYNITKASYSGSVMASDWLLYEETSYFTTREHDAAFYAGSFYDIVLDYKANYEATNPDFATTSWDNQLRTLLQACSSLVIFN